MLNSTGNVAPRNYDNSFTFSYTGFTNTTPTVRASLVEPKLNIVKTLVTAPVDAGDPVIYRVVVSNPSGGVDSFRDGHQRYAQQQSGSTERHSDAGPGHSHRHRTTR